MKQQSFSDAGYAVKKKQTRREVFPAEMDGAVPWTKLEALVAPHYPKAGNGCRPYPRRRCCAFTACSNGMG